MKAYEFSTALTSEGKLVIPEPYRKTIPVGDSIRVIILINEENSSVTQEELELTEAPALEEVVEAIKKTPENSANIQAASGLLAEHLANSPETPDPSFDLSAWNRQWDELETEMKRLETV